MTLSSLGVRATLIVMSHPLLGRCYQHVEPPWSMPSLSNFETSGAVGVSAHPPGTSFAPHLQRYFRVSSDTPFAPAKLASKTMPRVLG